MNWFNQWKSRAALDRIAEEKLYEAAYRELDSGHRRAGLWAKAVAKSEGSKEKTRSLYIQLLIQRYKDDSHLQAEIMREALNEHMKHQPQTQARDAKPEWTCSVCNGALGINYGTSTKHICKKCAYQET